MIIRVPAAGRPFVEEADNLRAFKMVVGGSAHDLPARCAGIAVIEDEHAWVEQAWIRSAVGPSASEEWRAGFDRMIDFARSRGWTRGDDSAVRAHIEYA